MENSSIRINQQDTNGQPLHATCDEATLGTVKQAQTVASTCSTHKLLSREENRRLLNFRSLKKSLPANIPQLVKRDYSAPWDFFCESTYKMQDVHLLNAQVLLGDIDENDNWINDGSRLISLGEYIDYTWGEGLKAAIKARNCLEQICFLDETGYPSKKAITNNYVIWFTHRNVETGNWGEPTILLTTKGQHAIQQALYLLRDSKDYQEYVNKRTGNG